MRIPILVKRYIYIETTLQVWSHYCVDLVIAEYYHINTIRVHISWHANLTIKPSFNFCAPSAVNTWFTMPWFPLYCFLMIDLVFSNGLLSSCIIPYVTIWGLVGIPTFRLICQTHDSKYNSCPAKITLNICISGNPLKYAIIIIGTVPVHYNRTLFDMCEPSIAVGSDINGSSIVIENWIELTASVA